jgi:hypothetical protein
MGSGLLDPGMTIPQLTCGDVMHVLWVRVSGNKITPADSGFLESLKLQQFVFQPHMVCYWYRLVHATPVAS